MKRPNVAKANVLRHKNSGEKAEEEGKGAGGGGGEGGERPLDRKETLDLNRVGRKPMCRPSSSALRQDYAKGLPKIEIEIDNFIASSLLHVTCECV